MDDHEDAAATQLLLDELTRLDDTNDSGPSVSLPMSPPPPDEVDSLLADLLPRSPTAQFLTFFAAEGHDLAASSDELLDFDLDLLGDQVDTVSATNGTPPKSSSIVPLKRRKPPRRSPAYDSNRARNERRHELAYLRRKVADMETELARARAASGHHTNLATVWSGQVVVRQQHRPRPGVWEQIAGRQLEERHRAERENVRLRAALELQLKVAKSLEAILNKPALTKSLDAIAKSGVVGTCHAITGTTIDEADRALLQQLLDHVEQIHTQTDELIRDAAAPANAGIRTASSGSLAEIFVTDLMPFTLEAASKAAWSYFSYKKNYLPVPSRLYYERHDVDGVSIEDTVLESSSMERGANGITPVVQIKQALRRYVERERVVVAWSAVSQSVEINGVPFNGCNLREWGCMVLRPANPTERREIDDPLSPLTVLQSCYFIAPEFKDGTDLVATTCDIGQLTECILAFTTARMSTWRQRIENILLDEQLAASR